MVRLAATVMLVRPGGREPMEVFMLRRSAASHFVPDAYVFPGGTLDAADLSPEALERTHGADADAVKRQFRAVPPAPGVAPRDAPTGRERAGLLVAAVRELYEEAGVLLACDASGSPCRNVDATLRARLHDAREQVHSGRLRFDALLRELDLYANADALALFSQWITPPAYERRYDAHFFVALAGESDVATADATETHDGLWIAPCTALERVREGSLRMVYPTIKHVERLARFDDAQALIDFARRKPIVTIMPDTIGHHEFALPPELEYAW